MHVANEARERLKAKLASGAFVRSSDAKIILGRNVSGGWLFDLRAVVLQPEFLQDVTSLFWESASGDVQIGGLETAAIPLISAIVIGGNARSKKVNGFYIRKSRDKDGLMKQIEGTLNDDPVMLVDDLTNSGKSILRQVEILEKIGKKVNRIWTIIRFRDQEYYDFFAQKGISVESIFDLNDFTELLDVKNLEKKPSLAEQMPYRSVWTFKSDHPSFHYVLPKSDPVLDETRIYVGSDTGIMWALNQSDGTPAWSYKIGEHAKGKGIFSSPRVHDGVVYFGGYDGNIYALDASTGAKKWVSLEADWIGSTPALAPDIGCLFIGLEYGLFRKRGGLACIDLASGKTRWAFREMPCYTHSTPLYLPHTREVVIGSNDGAVYLFDAEGGLVWKYESGMLSDAERDAGFSRFDIKESFAFDAVNDRIIGANMNGDVFALDRRTGEKRRSFKMEFGSYATPVIHDDAVFVTSLDKNLYCLNLALEKRWAWNAGARIFATPVIIDTNLYIGANTGRLTEIDPASGRATSFLQLTERITNRVAYNPSTKRFFVPTFANEIYSVEKTGI